MRFDSALVNKARRSKRTAEGWWGAPCLRGVSRVLGVSNGAVDWSDVIGVCSWEHSAGTRAGVDVSLYDEG